ncbi:hypothetical protein PG995_008508 [Apiospora arundinis]|uniref:YisB protein n=1 Tax=Apiospora arundinis TaxID=335852 RepID=A0ABR2JPC7_9PEZI
MIEESEPEQDHQKNFDVFRDCLAAVLIQKVSKPQPKARRRAKASSAKKSNKSPTASAPASASAFTSASVSASAPSLAPTSAVGPNNNGESEPSSSHDAPAATSGGDNAAEDLADFIDYIATETYASLPPDLQTLDYYIWKQDQKDDGLLQSRFSPPLTSSDVSALLLPTLDPSVAESLHAYGLADEPTPDALAALLAPVLTSLAAAVTAVPPAPSATKSAAQEAGCELCGRDWVPLTYHHLIPRFVHAKAVKRGWHKPEDLQNVAWLCAACHRAVHRFASHEDLARYCYTVDRLLEQDEIVQFAKWVSRVRWKGR